MHSQTFQGIDGSIDRRKDHLVGNHRLIPSNKERFDGPTYWHLLYSSLEFPEPTVKPPQ